MTIQILTLGALRTKCYIVWDDNGEGAVIDPADEAARVLDVVRAHNIRVRTVLLTHSHFDHMLAAREIILQTGASLALHTLDIPALTDVHLNLAGWLDGTVLPALTADRPLNDGDVVEVGDIRLRVIHTPGHTVGSCCYYSEEDGTLFSGDTLFCGSAGRTDFPGGSLVQLRTSLARLMELPDTVCVYAGHEESTTIGFERCHNPFIG